MVNDSALTTVVTQIGREWATGFADLGGWAVGELMSRPSRWWVLVLAAAYLLTRTRRARWRRRDPERWFTSYQRGLGRARAGGRCEYGQRRAPWRRCPAPAQECDHFFPWARGGATSTSNLVAACTTHNQTKGARTPGRITRWLISWRRRAYFPAGDRRRPGAWHQAGAR